HITAVHHPWWLNFLLHWSFLLELALVVAAIAMWCRRNAKMVNA
ncbi:TPA: metal-dependent hydrolase, partial [Escherichia coli]|nr:metal-dependent hydrolase [Escherichia coli]HCS8469276.1 metal-dependent hydrolase [Escherichia coli]